MLDNMQTKNLEVLIWKLTKKEKRTEAEEELLKLLIQERKQR